MSEKQMEDLRQICLICGCHTSQIINVFEPRNGPNIVELIQAKFKFQVSSKHGSLFPGLCPLQRRRVLFVLVLMMSMPCK